MQVGFGATLHGYRFYGSNAGKKAATTANILRNIKNSDIVPGSIKESLNIEPPHISFSTHSDGIDVTAALKSELAQNGHNFHMVPFNPEGIQV